MRKEEYNGLCGTSTHPGSQFEKVWVRGKSLSDDGSGTSTCGDVQAGPAQRPRLGSGDASAASTCAAHSCSASPAAGYPAASFHSRALRGWAPPQGRHSDPDSPVTPHPPLSTSSTR